MNPRHLKTSLAVLALALPATRAAAQPDVVSITRRANPAVITLNTYNASGRQTGLGSGFFLSDGRIATNRHVVEGSSRIDVMTVDGRKLGTVSYAEAVGGATADLAILPRVTNPPATLPLARGLPEAGEGVVVIGAPEGLSNTVSTGIVSAIRQLTGRTLVQISAPISHGSSGGPVLNMRGEVIGVSVSVLSEGQNLNFAVPVTELSRLATGPRGRIDFSGDLRFGGRGTGRGSAPSERDISDLNLGTLPRITAGQTVTGRLTTGDFRRPDGSYADAYVYTGRAGEVITVTLRSNAFDAWAVVDDPTGPMREHDDDSGGNLDAQLSVTLPHAGQYLIVANSVAEGATGAYTLAVSRGGTPQNDGNDNGNNGGQVSSGDEFDVNSARPISSGQSVSGTLTRSDTRRSDGSYADSYLYNGRAGERLTVTLRASGFQPWIVVDEPDGPFREHNGGRGSGTAVLNVTLPRTGRYIILANSVDAGGTGSYSMTVQGGGGGSVDDTPRSGGGGDISDMDVRSLPRIVAGQQVSGRITTSDFLRTDGSYADGYVYQGRAGETITVTMRSPDMDAWVVVDDPNGPLRETDDDSAGGTDAELTVTLPRTALYLIVANSVGDPNTGRYTLFVRSGR